MKILIILLLIMLVLISSCTKTEPADYKMNKTLDNKTETFNPEPPVDISFRTQDNVIIRAVYYPNPDSERAIILLHQLGKDKSSYAPWISYFQKEFNVLAIDLRGHGSSERDYRSFSNQDFINMKYDIEAAQNFMIKKGFPAMKISYVGASIGANTVQNFVSRTDYDKAILLSPGIEYRGITLEIKNNNIMAIASKEDKFAYETVKKLEDNENPSSEFIYLENKGHGTNMLDDNLMEKIMNYLKK